MRLSLANCKTAEKHAGKTTIYDDIYAEICDCMAQAYGEMGQYQDGLFWSERYRTISDSLNNLGYALELEQKELSGDLEQQQIEDQLLAEMDREKKKAEIEHDLWMKTIYLIIGIVLFAGFIVVLWSRDLCCSVSSFAPLRHTPMGEFGGGLCAVDFLLFLFTCVFSLFTSYVEIVLHHYHFFEKSK